MRWAEKEKKNFSPEFRSYPTRARKFQKNSKKIQKTQKLHFGFISIQIEMKLAEKERKKFYSRIPFTLDLGKNIPKKIAKKIKKLKNLGPALFLSKKG